MPFSRSAEKADLAAIHEVAKTLTSTGDLRRSLNTALRTLQNLLAFDRTALFLPDPETREIRMEVASGYSRDEMERSRYLWGEGTVGTAMKTGSPIAIPDVRTEPSFLDRTGVHRGGSEPVSFLAVPLKVGQETLGVLSAERYGRAGTTALEGDARTLSVVGCLMGQAIKLHAAIERLQEEFQRQRREFEKTIRKTYRIGNIIGQGKRMQELFASVSRVAPSKATVLLRGESGTGKEMIARAIHTAGPRSRKALITVNCAALPETLLESELFGHRRGAFTGATSDRKGRFEEADGGTLFLDEIGEIPLSTQVKLLRVLQDRTFERLGENRPVTVDVRIIAATNADLEKLVEEGKFREDLYYRLNVIPLYLPPLRDRPEDVLALVEHFLERFNGEHGKAVSLAPETLELLMAYRWPGNVRELENLVERLVVTARAPVVTVADLPRSVRLLRAPGDGTPAASAVPPAPGEKEPPRPPPEGTLPSREPASAPPPSPGGPGKPSRAAWLKELEREELLRALSSSGWVVARAARLLGWTPRQVGYKMKTFGLVSPWKKTDNNVD
jgi:Nif-specific regulatory protein